MDCKEKDKLKKAIKERYERVICPNCGETRSMMLLLSKSDLPGWPAKFGTEGDTIICVSCKKEFEK